MHMQEREKEKGGVLEGQREGERTSSTLNAQCGSPYRFRSHDPEFMTRAKIESLN